MNDSMSYGKRAVRFNFNPRASDLVNRIKENFANIIDICNDARTSADDPEVQRMYSLAITEAQTAQMWAVKAAMWRK